MSDTNWTLEIRVGDTEHWVPLESVDADAALERIMNELRGPHDWVEVRRVSRRGADS